MNDVAVPGTESASDSRSLTGPEPECLCMVDGTGHVERKKRVFAELHDSVDGGCEPMIAVFEDVRGIAAQRGHADIDRERLVKAMPDEPGDCLHVLRSNIGGAAILWSTCRSELLGTGIQASRDFRMPNRGTDVSPAACERVNVGAENAGADPLNMSGCNGH